MSNRQYVACQFNPWDRRTYTYHNDGAPVAPGDKVKVETRYGLKIITVDSIVDEAPKFETKAILEKVADESVATEGGH
jgi:hypothetical protein